MSCSQCKVILQRVNETERQRDGAILCQVCYHADLIQELTSAVILTGSERGHIRTLLWQVASYLWQEGKRRAAVIAQFDDPTSEERDLSKVHGDLSEVHGDPSEAVHV